jgi:hypothetical protein
MVEELPSPKFHIQAVGIFSDESMNFTVSGANPIRTFEVNRATGMDVLILEVLEFVALPERPVPLIVELCAADIRGTSIVSVGVAIPRGPVPGVPADDATYWSGSVGISPGEFPSDSPGFITGLEVVERKEHPHILTNRMTRTLAMTSNLYIDIG